MNLNKLNYIQKYGEGWEEPYYENHPLIPKGYMIADGSRLKVEAFPELYEVIGKAYEDSLDPNRNFDPKTFPIPDLRSHFPHSNGKVKLKPGDTAFIIKAKTESSISTLAPIPVGTVLQYILADK